MKPLISIVIPAYNEEKYILKTLQSLAAQDFRDYEVIVVANGCTDDTEKVVQSQAAKVKLYSLPKANVSRARNFGAGKAQGELLFFLDADTQLDKGILEKAWARFKDGAYVVGSTKVIPDRENWRFKVHTFLKSFYLTYGLYKGCSGALICRREAFDRINGYNPNLTVKEHRKLILLLLKEGKYTCVDGYVQTSMRRFEQKGLSRVLWFWTKQLWKDKFSSLEGSEYEKVR